MKLPAPVTFFAVLLLVFVAAQAQVTDDTCSTCQFTVGRAISALDFSNEDGTSLRLPKPLSAALPRSMTIEAWVLQDSDSGEKNSIISRYDNPVAGDDRSDFNLQTDPSGQLVFFMGTSNTDGSDVYGLVLNKATCGNDILLVDKTWHHVAVTVNTPVGFLNPDSVRMYLDGALVCAWGAPAEGNTTSKRQSQCAFDDEFNGFRNFLTDESIVVSGYLTEDTEPDAQEWNGLIDEIRIWNHARTQADLQQWMYKPLSGSEDGLLAYYRLDNELGPTADFAIDSSGNSYDAQLIGRLGRKPDWVGSTAPLLHRIDIKEVDPNESALVPLYSFSNNPDDDFNAIVTELPEFGTLYRDSNLTEVYEVHTPIQVEPGQRWAFLYYSPNQENTPPFIDELTYITSGRQLNSEPVTSKNPDGTDGFAQIYFVIDPGCDGQGGEYDRCGVCNGDNDCLSGCDNQPFSTLQEDDCGVCGGLNLCVGGCDSLPHSTAEYDNCGVCGGDNACFGCDGQGGEYDECGVCNGQNECLGCDGQVDSGLEYDRCGVCGGQDECICDLEEWRGFGEPELDARTVFTNIEDLEDELDESKQLLETLVRNLASGTLPPDCDKVTEALAGLDDFIQSTRDFSNAMDSFRQELWNNVPVS